MILVYELKNTMLQCGWRQLVRCKASDCWGLVVELVMDLGNFWSSGSGSLSKAMLFVKWAFVYLLAECSTALVFVFF